MTRIAIIVGSTRPGRRALTVAAWVQAAAERHSAVKAGEVSVDLVDLADFGLPVLDEPVPAAFGQYSHEHTRRWSEAIASYDGYVFVTAEYNRSIPGALKNAIDYLYSEWHDKAAGFVSYGVLGGTRAVEQLRLVLTEVKIAHVPTQVALPVFTEFTFTDPTDPTDAGVLTPGEHQEPSLHKLLDEVVAWSDALKPLREKAPEHV